VSGREDSTPVTGSVKPATSSFTTATTRVSMRSTPGVSASRAATASGARVRRVNTSAKR